MTGHPIPAQLTKVERLLAMLTECRRDLQELIAERYAMAAVVEPTIAYRTCPIQSGERLGRAMFAAVDAYIAATTRGCQRCGRAVRRVGSRKRAVRAQARGGGRAEPRQGVEVTCSHSCGGGPDACGGCCACLEWQAHNTIESLARERDAAEAVVKTLTIYVDTYGLRETELQDLLGPNVAIPPEWLTLMGALQKAEASCARGISSPRPSPETAPTESAAPDRDA